MSFQGKKKITFQKQRENKARAEAKKQPEAKSWGQKEPLAVNGLCFNIEARTGDKNVGLMGSWN